MDFGLAKLVEDGRGPIGATGLSTHTPMTAEGTILGTMQYMAPEQLEAKEADARTDIFAFGAIVYEMVTGRRSFDAKSQASLIAAILDRDPPSMSTLQPTTPSSLERVIRKCLAKDPDARWQSAGDLLEELKWIADGTLGDAGPAHGCRTQEATSARRLGHGFDDSPGGCSDRPRRPLGSTGGGGRPDQIRGPRAEHLEST